MKYIIIDERIDLDNDAILLFEGREVDTLYACIDLNKLPSANYVVFKIPFYESGFLPEVDDITEEDQEFLDVDLIKNNFKVPERLDMSNIKKVELNDEVIKNMKIISPNKDDISK